MKTLADFGFNGKSALTYCIKESEYKTVAQAVASLALFTNPKSIEKTQGKNIFKIIRSMAKRGNSEDINGLRVLFDDNTAPTDTFLWANGIKRKEYVDVTFCHILAQSDNVELYTSLANICMIPTFLAKLTDTDASIKAFLSYRAYKLYGSFLHNSSSLTKPKLYDELTWAEANRPIDNLEEAFLSAMKTKPRNRATISARELGWYYSN